MIDLEFKFNDQVALSDSERDEIRTQHRRQYAANKGLTLEQYDAEQLAHKQRYIDDPTLFAREQEEAELEFQAEMKEMDDHFFKLTGKRIQDVLDEMDDEEEEAIPF